MRCLDSQRKAATLRPPWSVTCVAAAAAAGLLALCRSSSGQGGATSWQEVAVRYCDLPSRLQRRVRCNESFAFMFDRKLCFRRSLGRGTLVRLLGPSGTNTAKVRLAKCMSS